MSHPTMLQMKIPRKQIHAGLEKMLETMGPLLAAAKIAVADPIPSVGGWPPPSAAALPAPERSPADRGASARRAARIGGLHRGQGS